MLHTLQTRHAVKPEGTPFSSLRPSPRKRQACLVLPLAAFGDVVLPSSVGRLSGLGALISIPG